MEGDFTYDTGISKRKVFGWDSLVYFDIYNCLKNGLWNLLIMFVWNDVRCKLSFNNFTRW
jgi:hypothetical protein